ncbi:hypothetical protein ADU60_20460 [Vibrio coralliilyticus]|nr:hypothetical protein DVV14_17650 [Vibrio coralliilyticus]KPH23790.1 hypothetical protein ADU60_20460 [Vibrio coralliilyticus]
MAESFQQIIKKIQQTKNNRFSFAVLFKIRIVIKFSILLNPFSFYAESFQFIMQILSGSSLRIFDPMHRICRFI